MVSQLLIDLITINGKIRLRSFGLNFSSYKFNLVKVTLVQFISNQLNLVHLALNFHQVKLSLVQFK
mgnify:CR=1 FL=1